jgi:two-component system NtrC family response regulator
MACGAFREDLYYRLSEITVNIPPLRERHGGRLVLARHVLSKVSEQLGRDLRGFSDSAQQAIDSYSWPGNVRELENKIKAAVIMAEGRVVTAEDLGLAIEDTSPDLNLRVIRQRAETQAIQRALIWTSGNISRAAELLGVTRPTLYDLMEKHGLRTEVEEHHEPQRRLSR